MSEISNLLNLQSKLKDKKIDLLIVNRSDEFLNEYISPYAERLQFISNFSGSAGKAIVLQNEAYLYVDGRYTFQAKEQINENEIKSKHLKSFWEDLKTYVSKKSCTIAVDPKLHSIREIQKIQEYILNTSSNIIFLESNIIDSIWKNKPSIKYSNIFDHPIKYSGVDRVEKLINFKKIFKEKNIDHYLVTGLDNIAWLLNIRADDILYTPLVYAYLLISKNEKPSLYINDDKINIQLKSEIEKNINICSINNIENIFSNIINNDLVGLDFSATTYYFLSLLEKKNIKYKDITNSCILTKAIKNQVEQTGACNANLRDGVSITRFIYWLKNEMDINTANEILASNYLKSLRVNNKLFHSLSFDTISAFGKNAALPHYRVDKDSNTKFKMNNIYLVDSGAQYYDGTTDITRTIIIGTASDEQKDRFTRVLKGHIALSSYVFKKGTKGTDIDYLARKSLNEINCDYDHGTGHGIGSFLSVHEAPQRIAKKSMFESVELIPGMILSNEPGYYKLNEYGIRIENLILVKEDSNNNLYFENLSWCPIDKDLIKKNLLDQKEIDWVNNYHSKVYTCLYESLSSKELEWLKEATKPL
jgi:Xaa-Pro aminopeptidase